MLNQFINFYKPIFDCLRVLAKEPFFIPIIMCIVSYPLTLIIKFFKVGK